MLTTHPLSLARCAVQPRPFHGPTCIGIGIDVDVGSEAADPTPGAQAIGAFDAARFQPVGPATPMPWTRIRACDLAAVVASARPSGQVQASAALRGAAPADGPAPPAAQDLERQALAIRTLLRDYALQEPRPRDALAVPAEVLSGLRSQSIDILLATRAEYAALLRESGAEPAKATSRIAVLHAPPRILVDAQRFFLDAPGEPEPSPAAKNNLLSLFIHPRWRELLQPAKQLLGLPRRTLEDALHRYVRNRATTSVHVRLAALHDALLAGDAAGVMRAALPSAYASAAEPYAVLPRRVAPLAPTMGTPPALPTSAERCDAVADALSSERPRTAAARQLRQLLGPRAQVILEAAVARREPEALRRIGYAQALVYTHALVSGVVAELSGGRAGQAPIDIDLRFPGGSARYGQEQVPDAGAAASGAVLIAQPVVARVTTADRAALLRSTLAAIAGPAMEEAVLRIAESLPEASEATLVAPGNALFQYIAGKLAPADRTLASIADDRYLERVILARSMRHGMSPDEALRQLLQAVLGAYPAGHPQAGRRDDEIERFIRDMLVQLSKEHRSPGGLRPDRADAGTVVGYHTAILAGDSAIVVLIAGEANGRLKFAPPAGADPAMLRLAGAEQDGNRRWTIDPKYVATVGIALDAGLAFQLAPDDPDVAARQAAAADARARQTAQAGRR